MNEAVLTIDDAARCLPELVERIHLSGESTLLVKSGRPLVRIVAVPTDESKGSDLISFLRDWRIEHPEPDEQFADTIESSRSLLQMPHDPWE